MQQQKILLLENVAAQAAGVRERLSQAGYQVAVSRYEADGLKRLTEWRPELVLLSTSHPAGNLVEYCRRARSLAPSARIVVTSSLNRERLLQEHPELEGLVDGVLLRPYSFEEAVRLLRPDVTKAPAAPQPPKLKPERLVIAPEGDPELEARLRWGLEPNGVRVVTLAPAAVEAFCGRERPGVLILEWPLPPAFAAEGLARVRSGPGAPAGVLLLADDSREAVSAAAPALLHLVDMFFRKPVAWEHFFRVLARHLRLPEVAGAKPDAPRPAPAPPRPPTDEEGLRAEFQRQLEAKFLEVEELKRRLEEATRRAGVPSAGGPGELQAENERLRQALQEAAKKTSLALAMENLKRSELEVKLDNLLRMKDDFERRAQDDLEARTREGEGLRRELEEARAGAERAAGELKALGAELERSLVEKEQLEERLHRLGSGPPPEEAAGAPPAAAPDRLEALEAEVVRQRALAAEAEASGADATAKAAVLEEELARSAAGLAREHQLREEGAAALRAALERVEAADRRVEELLAERSELEGQAIGAVAGRRSAEAALAEVISGRAELERELAAAREERAGDAQREQELRERAAAEAREALDGAERRCGQLQEELRAQEARARASEASRVSVAAEAEAAVAEIGERLASLERELREAREAREQAGRLARELQSRLAEREPLAAQAADLSARLEASERELALLRESAPPAAAAAAADRERLERLEREIAEAGRAAGEVAAERDRLRESLGETSRQVAEREREVAALEARWAAEESRLRELPAIVEELRQARAAAGETGARLERAEAELARERAGAAAREAETQLRLEAAEGRARSLEERLAEEAGRQVEEGEVRAELRRIQELLEGVIARARDEAVSHARGEAEMGARLQAALEDRRLLQERIERSQAEAAERERRSAALLQSAIERGPTAPQVRENLPALLPPERRWRLTRRSAWAAGLTAVAALAVGLAIAGRRGPVPPAVRDPGPEVSLPGRAAGGSAGPQAVWDRWTRSDGSGGVLVQATLRSEQELRAEVDAERASRGWSEAEARAELVRRLAGFRFETTYYVTVYLKHLAPGYPAYLDQVAGRFRLRSGAGRETPAFIPPGHEKSRRVFSFGSGPAAEKLYEATVTLGFARADLESRPSYLQLVASDVGATSRRALTWELE